MELNSTSLSARNWNFLQGSFREGQGFNCRSMAICRFVMTRIKFSCQSDLYFYLFRSIFFHKIDTRQNESHRMQHTSTSRSTDCSRLKPITSKTPLTLYGSGVCAGDRAPTTSGSPAGPQLNQMYGFCRLFCAHSDSLDTLLYVRFAIQNLEFYEWKLGDRGWALS